MFVGQLVNQYLQLASKVQADRKVSDGAEVLRHSDLLEHQESSVLLSLIVDSPCVVTV